MLMGGCGGGAGGYWSCVGVSSWGASVHEAGGLRGTDRFWGFSWIPGPVCLGFLWGLWHRAGACWAFLSCSFVGLFFSLFFKRGGLGLFRCAVWGLSGVSMFSCVEHKSYSWNDFLLFFHMVLA